MATAKLWLVIKVVFFLVIDFFPFQEEEVVKPKQAKRRKKAISDSD